MRVRITEGLNSVTLANYQKVNHSEYVSWLTNDINMIEQSGVSAFFSFVNSLLTLVIAIASLTFYHYGLALLAVALGAINLLTPRFFTKLMERETKRLTTANSIMLAKIDDLIGGFSVFFSHNIGQELTRKVMITSDQQGSEKVAYTRNIGAVNLLISLLNIFAQMFMLALTAILAIGGYFTVGVISTSGQLSGIVFNNLSGVIQSVFKMKAVKTIIEKDIQVIAESQTNRQTEFKHSITVKNLSFSYGEQPVLEDVTYNFKKGGKYAIVGKSGTGKTTLINLISGRLSNYRGQITFDSQDMREMTSQEINQNIELIDQKSYLFNESVEQNITLDVANDGQLITKIIRFLGIDKFTNLTNLITEHGSNLSGGQRQKIALARAMAFNKPILVIDEVTAGVDRENAQEIENRLLAYSERTVIMITHTLTEETRTQLTGIVELSI